MDSMGLYLHIPFCVSKCKYCDFYSFSAGEDAIGEYVQALKDTINNYSKIIDKKINTLYIGGGTPSCIGKEFLCDVINCAKNAFQFNQAAEITCELNPDTTDFELVQAIQNAGVNRISMGMQSSNDKTLKKIGRIHTNAQVEKAVCDIKKAGINNISLDVMLFLPDETLNDILASVNTAIKLKPMHISAYCLKIEENTQLYNINNFSYIDEEDQQDIYIKVCKLLEENGYYQYEISNFSKEGFQSKHNLNYWQGGDYLGIGPGAHSFIDGKRFFFERDINKFIKNKEKSAVYERLVDTKERGFEMFITNIRTSYGANMPDFTQYLGSEKVENILNKAKLLEREGLCTVTDDKIMLTKKGNFLSNAVINYLF